MYSIEVEGVEIKVHRKRIKNLYLRVNRRNGKVRVSCPAHISEKNLIRFIHNKLTWIKAQKAKVADLKPEIVFSYQSGEKHYFFGKAYELKVEEGAAKSEILLHENNLVMKLRGKSDHKKREKLLESWYRDRLSILIEKFVRHYEPKMNVHVKEFRIRKMKTRWGTCNIRDQKIWLNLKLVEKDIKCLEMVVVHEMVHLLERLHNKRFYGLMDQFLPDWKKANIALNSFID